MTQLVGIAGQARSGKDTLAQRFVLRGWQQMACADRLKEGLAAMFSLPASVFYDDNLKDEPIVIGKMHTTPRYLMQTLGTEWGRGKLYNEVWSDLVLNDAVNMRQAGDNVVISDLRFESEASAVRAEGGTVIHVRRPNTKLESDHASENGLQPMVGDKIVLNDKGLQDYLRECDRIINAITRQ